MATKLNLLKTKLQNQIQVFVYFQVLVIELQMVLGGKTIELADDDYALAAFMLYTSIVDVFIKMVQILGLMED